MKRTKSMIYNETVESRELYVYTVNHRNIYNYCILPTINTLSKHMKKGNYSTEKAIDAWFRVATEGSKEYNKDFGYSFAVADRFSAAVDMEKRFLENIEEEIK